MVKEFKPKLRFSEFEETFKAVIFDDILSVTRLAGYEYSKYWKEDDNKEIIALRGYNIGRGKLELRDLSYISNKLSLQLKRSRLNKGDIIYPCVGTIGNAVVIEENDKYHIQQNIAKITCNKTTNPFFISQFLMSHLGMKEVLRFNATSSQPNVLVGSLRQFKINLPSLPEQQKIASFLSDVDDKITKLTKKKELLEQYKKGVMQKIFNQALRFKDDNGNAFPKWEVKKLGGLVKRAQSGGTPKSTNKSYYNGDIPFLSISDMTEQGKYLNYTTKSISQLGVDNSSTWIVPANSLIYSMYASVGFVSINKIELATSQAVMNLVLKEDIVLEYIYYYLVDFKKYIHRMIETGTQGNINASIVKSINIKIPSKEEQTKIANFLSDIDIKIEALHTKIENTQTFKKGLLQQMFV